MLIETLNLYNSSGMLNSDFTNSHQVNYDLFKLGDEKAFTYFYNFYYKLFVYRAARYVKDDVVSNTIAQEAFLRLWVMRSIIVDLDHMLSFLNQQVKEAVKLFYKHSASRFHRAMLRIDAIENFHDFFYCDSMEPVEDDVYYIDELAEEKRLQIKKINSLIPNISEENQLYIRLCLKFSFNYERIAYYLGGISDYEVGLNVEKCILKLKILLTNASNMKALQVQKPLLAEGEFSEDQIKIFQLRYDLNYSFEKIADCLKLNNEEVRKAFVQAHLSLKAGAKLN